MQRHGSDRGAAEGAIPNCSQRVGDALGVHVVGDGIVELTVRHDAALPQNGIFIIASDAASAAASASRVPAADVFLTSARATAARSIPASR